MQPSPSKTERVFRDKSYLSPSFVPEKLFYREREQRQLKRYFFPLLEGREPDNIHLYGKRGTGKTALVRKVVDDLESKANKAVRLINIDCRQYNTECRVLRKTASKLGLQLPPSGLHASEIKDKVIDKLTETKGVIVVLLDKTDHLLKKDGSGLVYFLSRLQEKLTEDKSKNNVTLSFISTSRKFQTLQKQLSSRSLSSAGLVNISLQPYGYKQLKKILERRAEKSLTPNAIEEKSIGLCTELASRNGDAKEAISLLRKAGELALSQGKEKIGKKEVKLAKEELQRERVQDKIERLTAQERYVLQAVVDLSTQEEMYSGEVYEQYKQICQSKEAETYTERRLGDFITHLASLNLISTTRFMGGKKGKTREIELAVPGKYVAKSLKAL